MTTTDESVAPSGAAPPVPVVIVQAIRRTGAGYYRALNLPLYTYYDQAVRAARLAAVCADRALCWEALAQWAAAEGSAVPWPLVSAIISARRREDDAARFWGETARYWRDRSAHRSADGGIGLECA